MDKSNTHAEALAEFKDAIPVHGFHRYFVANDGSIGFGLLGEDRKINYFIASPEAISRIAMQFLSLTAASQNILKPGDVNKPIELPFDTSAAMALTPQTHGLNGAIQLTFVTPANMIFSTLLGPHLTGQLVGSLLQAFSSMANPPRIFELNNLNSKLAGEPHEGNDTEIHFGQRYKTKILNILGLLVIRANLMEASMVNMLAALLELPLERAESIFYSSQNMKARSDMLRATAKTAKLDNALLEKVTGAIEAVDKVSRRRNQLIHGDWSFKGDKFSVKERKPLANSKTQDAIESFKSIEVVVQDFHFATVWMDLITADIVASRAIAK